MKKKRVVSVIEILAIIIAVIAIVAFSLYTAIVPRGDYFESCILFPGLACTAFRVSTYEPSVFIRVQNGMGQDLEYVTLVLKGDRNTGACTDVSQIGAPLTLFGDGETKEFNFTCSTPPSGSRFKSEIEVWYTAKGQDHIKTGIITTKVE